MSASGVVLLVVGIVVAVAVVMAAIWIPVIRWLRRRSAELARSMASDAAAAGEHIVIGPVPGMYRGGDSPYPSVKGNAMLMLTDRRLECRMATGAAITVAATDVAGAEEERWFRGAARGGRTHVVVSTAGGQRLGFYVADNARWIAALAPQTTG